MNENIDAVWNGKVITGNKNVDRDHYALFEIYNELKVFDGSYSEFAKILTKMTDFSLVHFKREEEYMKQMGYPKLCEHIKYHREYVLKVSTYNFQLFNSTPPSVDEILDFLKNWWVNHISNYDFDYENFKNINDIEASY